MVLMKRLGVGVNDAQYCTSYVGTDGKKVTCQVYRRWSMMFQRCYCTKFHMLYPTYAGCSVSPCWHTFTAFREWLQQQNWVGRQLDKDLLTSRNKVYSPERCMLVPEAINSLMNDSARSRGNFPIGVTLHERGRFHARVRVRGVQTYLGSFDTPEAASTAYKVAKIGHIESLLPSLTDEDPRLIPALRRIVFDLRSKL